MATPSARLPTGTVTFLFTDIEGSTRRWEAERAAMEAALARHNAILDRAIAAHTGHVFKTVGDAYCAAFAQAGDAVAAALDVQRALHFERWEERQTSPAVASRAVLPPTSAGSTWTWRHAHRLLGRSHGF